MSFPTIDPAFLLVNPWNSNHVSPEIEQRLENSIRELGMFKPVIVRQTALGLQILGGQHRAAVAGRMGIEVPYHDLGEIDDLQAKKIGLIDNARYGHDDASELAALLATIGHDEAMHILPYDQAELASLNKAVEIDLDAIGFEEDDTAPVETPVKVPKTHITMRFRIALENERAVSTTIQSLIDEHGLNDSDSLVNAGDALMLLIRLLSEKP